MSGSGHDEVEVVVDGAGLVGMAAARQLVAMDVVDRVGIASASEDRRRLAAEMLGPKIVPAGEIDRPAVAIIAAASGTHDDRAREWLARGSDVVSVSSDAEEIDRLRRLQPSASTAGRALVVGVAATPGLTSLLAVHAVAWFDETREIRVAGCGVAGSSCAWGAYRSVSSASLEWRDGEWIERSPGSGRELCWFPSPIDGRDCVAASSAEAQLLHDRFPKVDRISTRLARPDAPWLRRILPVGRRWNVDPIGAIRVEARGVRDGRPETLVYGMVDRPSVSTAAASAVTAGLVIEGRVQPGVTSLADVDTVGFLRRLAELGVRAAVFEGTESGSNPRPEAFG